MSLRHLVHAVRHPNLRVSPYDLLSLCQTMDSTAWGRQDADTWEAISKLATTQRVKALPTLQQDQIKSILARMQVLPEEFKNSMPLQNGTEATFNATEMADVIAESYARGISGRKMLPDKALPFFRRCADLCSDFEADTLVEVITLMMINEVRNDDVLRRLTQRLQLLMRSLQTVQICTLFHAYCFLGFGTSKFVRELASAMARQIEEFTYHDSVTALRGFSLCDPTNFDERTFLLVVGKAMEEIGNQNRVAFNLLKLITKTAADRSVQLPRHHLETLLQCANTNIDQERNNRLVVVAFVSFVQCGITSGAGLEKICDRITRHVIELDMVGVCLVLKTCAEIDEPMTDLILSVLDRACAVAHQANAMQLMEILEFMSQLNGAGSHRLVEILATHAVNIGDTVTPRQAAEMLVSLLRLQCKNHGVLLGLSRVVVILNPKDFLAATAVARVCFETGNRDKMFVKYYHTATSVLIHSLKLPDLLLSYQSLKALQIKDAQLDAKIARCANNYCRADPNMTAQLPPDFQAICAAQAATQS